MSLTLGIAGAGLIGRAHVDRMRRSAECRLAAIADPGPTWTGLAISAIFAVLWFPLQRHLR